MVDLFYNFRLELAMREGADDDEVHKENPEQIMDRLEVEFGSISETNPLKGGLKLAALNKLREAYNLSGDVSVMSNPTLKQQAKVGYDEFRAAILRTPEATFDSMNLFEGDEVRDVSAIMNIVNNRFEIGKG